MRQSSSLSPAAVIIAMIFPLWAGAQAAPVSLQGQLNAQYKLVKMGSDSSGPSVVEAGTLLAIQKGGILGVAYSDQSVLSTKYQDGTIHTPNALLSKGIGLGLKRFGKEQTTHLFQVGDKVYPSKLEVNVSKDTVALNIVACDTCNKTDPPTYNKAQVVFQFAKGSLATANPSQIEDTIGQVLSIDSGDDSKQSGGNDAQGNQNGQAGQGQQGGQEQQPEQQAAPAEPQTIQLGQTPDQVKAALGQPDKIVNLGPKQIYVYKDLKVTFVNSKVTDVQ